MLSFPPSLNYTWDSKTPAEDLNNITNHLSLASSYSVAWEIEISLKFAKVLKTNGASVARGRQNLDAKSSASYFIRFPDIGVCCVVTKEKDSTVDSVHVCTDAEIEEKYASYIHRSSWRATGQRFYVGSILISVGFIEHAGSAVKPCMEMSYCPEEDGNSDNEDSCTNRDLNRIAFRMHKASIDLLTAHSASHSTPVTTVINEEKDTTPTIKEDAENPRNNKNSVLATSVGSRAKQWLALVTH